MHHKSAYYHYGAGKERSQQQNVTSLSLITSCFLKYSTSNSTENKDYIFLFKISFSSGKLYNHRVCALWLLWKDSNNVSFLHGNGMLLQLASYGLVHSGKSDLKPTEIILSAGRFTLYMLLKSWSDTEGARNPCQIARHQASKGPTQPFNNCAFQAL